MTRRIEGTLKLPAADKSRLKKTGKAYRRVWKCPPDLYERFCALHGSGKASKKLEGVIHNYCRNMERRRQSDTQYAVFRVPADLGDLLAHHAELKGQTPTEFVEDYLADLAAKCE